MTCLIESGADPHVYNATPTDRRAIESADLILYGGYGFEPDIIQMVEAADGDIPQIAVAEAAVSEPILGVHHDHGSHSDEEHDDEDHDEMKSMTKKATTTTQSTATKTMMSMATKRRMLKKSMVVTKTVNQILMSGTMQKMVSRWCA